MKHGFHFLALLIMLVFSIPEGRTDMHYGAGQQGVRLRLSSASQANDTVHYRRRHIIRYFDGKRMQQVDACDTLTLDTGASPPTFAINVTADNGHICRMRGTLQQAGGDYIHREKLDPSIVDDGSTECTLRLESHGNEIVLSDHENVCRLFYCGMRGKLDGLVFSSGRCPASKDDTPRDEASPDRDTPTRINARHSAPATTEMQ